MYSIDLIGKEFHFLKVQSYSRHIPSTRKGGGYLWWCLCTRCNKTIEVEALDLRRGHKKSCGCWHPIPDHKCGKDNIAWKGYGEISGSIWLRIKQVAKDRGKKFDIKIEDVWDLYIKQDRKCALSGLPIVFAKLARIKKGDNTASLDRIDSKKGYTIDNVQWVHVKVNYMKQSLGQEEFIYFCNLISNQRKLVV
jgi:hypothetical protein